MTLRSEITIRMPRRSDTHIANGEHKDFADFGSNLATQISPVLNLVSGQRKDLRVKMVQLIIVYEETGL